MHDPPCMRNNDIVKGIIALAEARETYFENHWKYTEWAKLCGWRSRCGGVEVAEHPNVESGRNEVVMHECTCHGMWHDTTLAGPS